MKNSFMLIKKNQGKRKIIWKSKKIRELKKIFEKWSGIKTIQKKTKVLKFILRLKSRKLFENWSFEN